MGRRAPSQIPDPGAALPRGVYRVQVEEVEDVTQERVAYNARVRVVEPPSHAGSLHFERFFIGTDDDPDANDEATWKKGGGPRLKQFCSAGGVQLEGNDLDQVCQDMRGKFLTMHAFQQPDKKSGAVYTRVRKWELDGAAAPGVEEEDSSNSQAPNFPQTPPGQGYGQPQMPQQGGYGTGTPPPQPAPPQAPAQGYGAPPQGAGGPPPAGPPMATPPGQPYPPQPPGGPVQYDDPNQQSGYLTGPPQGGNQQYPPQ